MSALLAARKAEIALGEIVDLITALDEKIKSAPVMSLPGVIQPLDHAQALLDVLKSMAFTAWSIADERERDLERERAA